MTALREDTDSVGEQSDIDLYFELAGYQPHEIIGICWMKTPTGTDLDWAHVKVANVAAEITKHQGTNCWINAAIFKQKPTKRGKEEDMGRLPALYADLDFKSFSKLPAGEAIDDQAAIDTVNDVIATLSALLGEMPTVVINSGGGAQPRWRADRDIDKPTLVRFGKLVRQVCQEHDGDTDSVYDRARLLRAPGSINSGWKNGKQVYPQPRPTEVIPIEDGDTINVDGLLELLDARGIHYKTERERPLAPTQPLPKGRGNKYTQATVDGAVADLKESATWPGGHRDMATGSPRGWEKFQADVAYRLASLAKASWNDLTLAQAQKVFLSAAPTDNGWTYDMASQKWDYQSDYAKPAAPPKDLEEDEKVEIVKDKARQKAGGEAPPVSGLSGSAGLSGLVRGVDEPDTPAESDILNNVRDWLSRFISTMDEGDLDLLTVWAVHTHLCAETYTTPRLVLDSPVPGSGKTTTLEHLQRLCQNPVLAASLSSPALLTRMLDKGPRTILIDEVDRSLRPDKDGVEDLLAVLNSGYKRGATRPVLVPVKGGQWEAVEMPTFAPVAMAGNSPDLPDDTRSRSVRVLLMPAADEEGIEESDWEMIEDDALELANQIREWCDSVRTYVRTNRPPLPEQVRGRARERWMPLKRVAAAAGGRWAEAIDHLAKRDIERLEIEREDLITQEKPGIVLIRDLAALWPAGQSFVSTTWLVDKLVYLHPEMWGQMSSFGKRLTTQRLGRMLVKSFNIHSERPDTHGPRGYRVRTLYPVFLRFGLDPLVEPDKPAEPDKPDTAA